MLKLASPVRSHSRSREQKQKGGLPLACRVLQGGIQGFRPLLIQPQPFAQRRRDPHSPDHLWSPALACREKGRRTCGAADGACVSAFGTTRAMIGRPQAAVSLG